VTGRDDLVPVHRRRAGRGRGDDAAGRLLGAGDRGEGGGDIRRLESRRLPKTLCNEGVGVSGALAEQQLEERVHELVKAVTVQVSTGLRLGVAPAHGRGFCAFGVSSLCPLPVGDGARRCVGPHPGLPLEDLEGHTHLPSIACLERHPAAAVRVGLRDARSRWALSQQCEHIDPQGPRTPGELEWRRARQWALPARGARPYREDAPVWESARVED